MDKKKKYILFDIDETKTKVWRKRLSDTKEFDIVRSSVTNINANIYVSPANGYGQLDGGIDKIYRLMFPSIQQAVNEKLKIYANKKPPLGVGSSLLVPVPCRDNYLLLAPTMDIPSKLKTPWNSFWAALSIFYLTQDVSGNVAIPGLGTGTGCIEPDEMVDMLILAWKVSQNFRIDEIYSQEYDYVSKSHLVLTNSLNEQPISESLQKLIQGLS